MEKNKVSEYERREAEFRGKVTAEIENIKTSVNDAIKGFNDSIKKSIDFMARTTERLKTGNKKFEAIDKDLDEQESTRKIDKKYILNRIEKVEDRSAPNGKKVYALIIIGFVILAFISSFKGCTKVIKYYDSESDKCDSTKYKCVDVREIN